LAEQVTVDVNQAEGVLETERVQGLEQASGTCTPLRHSELRQSKLRQSKLR